MSVVKAEEKDNLSHYPLFFNDARTELLNEVLTTFLSVFDEFSDKYQLTDEQVRTFKELIMEAYIARKAAYYLDFKLSEIIENSLYKPLFELPDSEETTSLLYLNKRSMVKNE